MFVCASLSLGDGMVNGEQGELRNAVMSNSADVYLRVSRAHTVAILPHLPRSINVYTLPGFLL